jgi:hypothetical protein
MIAQRANINFGTASFSMKRWMQGILLGAVLLGTTALLLAAALAWGSPAHPCKISGPMIVGCVLGNFEALASGLLAADAALLAGWLAWSTVQGQMKADSNRAAARAKDVARALHTELADLVARCCFDTEDPWRQCWSPDAPERAYQFDVTRLRSFAPVEPVIFPAVAAELATLGEYVPLRLVQFYTSLSALRRDIGNIADGANQNVPKHQVQQVALRFRLTLEPGLKALQALVSDANDIEASAIAPYDATRSSEPPAGTLRDRINRLLAIAATGSNIPGWSGSSFQGKSG